MSKSNLSGLNLVAIEYNCGDGVMTEEIIRLREEISMQIKALNELKAMAQHA